jgi:hypothetical protein
VLNSNVAGNDTLNAFRAKLDKRLNLVLTKKPIKRLDQIGIPRQGLAYLRRWDGRLKLKITREQRDEIEKVVRNSFTESFELSRQFQRKKLDRKTYFAKSKKHTAKTFQKALKILRVWKKATSPFSLRPLFLFSSPIDTDRQFGLFIRCRSQRSIATNG